MSAEKGGHSSEICDIGPKLATLKNIEIKRVHHFDLQSHGNVSAFPFNIHAEGVVPIMERREKGPF